MRAAPQQARSEVTVEKILQSANHLFGTLGFSATTTTAIAKAAEVSVGSLYHFFPDKAAIGVALGERYHEEMQAMLSPVLATVNDTSDFSVFVSNALRGAGDVVDAHPGYLRVVDEIDTRSPTSPFHELRTALARQLHTLAPQLGLGHLGSDDLSLITEFVIDVCAVMLRRLPADEPERTRWLDELELLFTHYVLARAR